MPTAGGEVVFATRDALAALDDGGNPLWSAREAMTLTTFLTGDLSRRHTNEVVALWNDEHSPASRLAVYAADGKRLGAFDHDRRLERVAVARPTTRHALKIIATSGNVVFLFDLKKLAAGKPLWTGRVSPRSDAVSSLEIVDGNGDGKSDIALTTASGARVFVDFTGHAIGARSGARFERVAPRRSRR